MNQFYFRIMGIILLTNLSFQATHANQAKFYDYNSVKVKQDQLAEPPADQTGTLDSILANWPFRTPELPPKYGHPDSPENMIPPGWELVAQTDRVHGIVVLLESNPRINDVAIQPGDFIGGFYLDENGNRKCGGYHVWDGSVNIGFPLFGADPATPEKDGFGFAELIEFRFFSWTTMKNYVIDQRGYHPESLSTNKWYPLGLTKFDDLKSNVDFDFYIQPSENPSCTGNELALTAQEFVGSGGTYTFLWTSSPPGLQSTEQSPPPFIIQQTTDYHLTVSDGVLVSEHTLTVNVNQHPVAYAGADGLTCANQAFQLNGLADNYLSTFWESSGDGTFNDSTLTNPTYAPGPADTEQGEIFLIFTAFPLSPCQMAATDTMMLTVSGTPSIVLEESVMACSTEPLFFEAEVANYSSLAWTTTGSGTFSAPDQPVTQYFGSSNDFNYGALIKLCAEPLNPCTVQECSTLQLTYISGPTVNTPNSRTRCENQTVPVNGIAYNYDYTEWVTSGDGTFANPNVFSTVYYPGTDDKANGGVGLTLMAYSLTNCPPASKTIAVTLVKLPEVVSFGPTANHICSGDNFMQLDATIENHNGFSWSTNGDGTFNATSILNPKYYPGNQDIQNGEFELVITAAPSSPCNVSTIATNPVSYQNNPAANAGQDATIGQDQSFTAIGATASDYASVLWSTSGNGTFDDYTLLNTTYTPTEDDYANQPISLTLTAVPVGPCTIAATDELLLSFNFDGCLNAIANAGVDRNFCENEVTSVQLQDAFAANYEFLIWTTDGDGTFDDPAQINPTYYPGVQDLNAAEITLTLFAQGVDDCESASDDVKIIIHQNPAADAGDNITACSNDAVQLSGYAENYTTVFWTTTGDGTFAGQNMPNATYFPGTDDATYGSVVLCLQAAGSSYCPPAEDCLEIEIVALPTAHAGPDATIDGGQPFSPAGASFSNTGEVLWSSNGDGTFDNPNQMHPTYFHGPSDYVSMEVTLSVSAAPLQPCQVSATDLMLLSITPDCPPVVANAGPDATICADQNSVPLTGEAPGSETVLWITSGDGTFDDETSMETYYTPGQNDRLAGEVTLTLIPFGAPPCPAGQSDAMTVSIIQPATLSVANDFFSICGALPVTLDAVASNYASVIWTTSGNGTFDDHTALSPVYTPGSNDMAFGEVLLTISLYPVLPCTEVLQHEVMIEITNNAFADAGNDQTICEDNTVLLSGMAGYYANILWTTSGDGQFTNAQQLSATYIPGTNDINQGGVAVTITAAPLSPCTIIAEDEAMIFITKNPVCYTDSDIAICEGEFAEISGTVDEYSNVSWLSAGTGTFGNSQSVTTQYYPSSGDVNNGVVILTLLANPKSPCIAVASDEMTVNIFRQPTVSAGYDQTICAGNPVQLDATASNYTTLNWASTGDGTFSASSTLSPQYWPGTNDLAGFPVELCLTATGNPACDVSTDCIQITVQTHPFADTGPNNTITFGDLFYTSQAQVSFAQAVEWSSPDGTGSFGQPLELLTTYAPSADDLAAGQITLVLTAYPISPCQVAATDAMFLQIIEGCEDPTVFAGSNMTVCAEPSTSIILAEATAENHASLQWSSLGDGTFSNSHLLNPVYYPGNGDLQNGSVKLLIEATAFGDCNNMSDDIIIFLQPLPQVNAGDDITVCEDEAAQLQATAENFSGILWETSGDGFFDDNTQLSAVYHPGTMDIETGNTVLTLTAYGIAPCQAVTSQLSVTINKNPEVFAGPDQLICRGANVPLSGDASHYETLAWSTTGDGTFTSLNSLNTMYTPGTNDIANTEVEICLTAIGSQSCTDATHCLLVTIQAEPTVDAGNDNTIVFGSPYVAANATAQNTSSLQWSTPDGLGSFSNSTQLNTTYLPDEEDAFRGFVTLVLTGYPVDPCAVAATDEMILTVLPNCEDPVVDAGSDRTICLSENVTISITDAYADNEFSLLWSTQGDGTFTSENTLMTSYTPGPADLAAGSTEICLTAFAFGICENKTDCLSITFREPPLVSAGSDLTICRDDAAQLQGEAMHFESLFWSTSGDGTFENAESLNTVYHPGNGDNSAGIVELNLWAEGLENCAAAQDDMTLTIAAPPEVFAGDDLTVCQTATSIALTAIADNFSQIQWHTTGNGSFSNENSLQTVYFPSSSDLMAEAVEICVTALSNENCSNTSDCLTVTFSAPPIATIEGDDLICAGSVANLSGMVEHAEEYVWSTSGSGTFANAENLAPLYYPSADDAYAGSVEICLTAFGLSGCNDTTICMTIEIQQNPVAHAGADATIQQGEFFVTAGASAQFYSNIQWATSGSGTFGDNTQVITSYHPSDEDIINGSVVISLTAQANQPCVTEATDAMTLTINYSGCFDAEVNAGENTTVCINNNVQLSGWAENYTSVLWTTGGDGSFDESSQTSTVYYPGSDDLESLSFMLYLEAYAAGNCLDAIDSVEIALQPLPVAFAGDNNTAPISVPYTFMQAFAEHYGSIQWATTNGLGFLENDQQIHPTYYAAPLDDGQVIEFLMVASATNPCIISADAMTTLKIISECEDAYADAGEDITLCAGEQATSILLENAQAANFESILWSTNGDGTFDFPNRVNPIYYPGSDDLTAENIVLTLQVNGFENCNAASDQLTIQRLDAPSVTAGQDQTLCETESIQLNGTAQNYLTLNWSTSGDGYFDDPGNPGATYFPGPADLQNGETTLCLTALGAGQCGTATHCFEVTFVALPTVDAGGSTTVCEEDTLLLDPLVVDAVSHTWSTLGDGTFDNNMLLQATYFPGPGDISSGFTQLQLTAFAGYDCGEASDNLDLTILKLPQVDAGQNATIGQGENFTMAFADVNNHASAQWSTSGDGTFNNINQINATYYPGINDQNALTVVLTLTAIPIAPCSAIQSDSMLLTIEEVCEDAQADAGEDTSLCSSDPVTLEGAAQNYSSVLWATQGDGTFENPQNLHTTYYPGAGDFSSGTAHLQLTAYALEDCQDATDNLMLTFFDSPVAIAGNDQTLCTTEGFVQLTGQAQNHTSVVWSSLSNGNFFYKNSLNATYIISNTDRNNGFVHVVLTANSENCGSTSDTLLVTLNPFPLVYAGEDATICGNAQLETYGYVEDAAGFEWSTSGDGTFNDPGSLMATYYPGASDIQNGTVEICLTAFALEGCDNKEDCIILTIIPSAYANAGSNQTVCAAEPVQLSGQAENYDSVVWGTSGDGTFENAFVPTTVYYPGDQDISENIVTVQLTAFSSSDCGEAVSEATIFIVDNPVADAGADQTICENNAAILNGMALNYTEIMWTTTGDGTFSELHQSTTSYIPGNNDIQNGFAELCLTATNDGICQPVSDCLILTIDLLPNISAGADQTVCESETVELSGLADAFSAITWNTNGDGTFSHPGNLESLYYPGVEDIATGTVSVCMTVTPPGACDAISDCVDLAFIPAPTIYAGEDMTVCETQTALLQASGSNYDFILWTTSGDGYFSNPAGIDTEYTPGANDLATGMVELTVSAWNGLYCETVTDHAVVIFQPVPLVSLDDNLIICEGDHVVLNAQTEHTAALAWSSNGDGTFEEASSASTIYYPGTADIASGSIMLCLSATGLHGCTIVTECVSVEVQHLPMVMAGNDLSICENGEVSLNATADNFNALSWSTSGDGTFTDPGSESSTYLPGSIDIATGEVQLCITATGLNDCGFATDCITITIHNLPQAIAGADITSCEGENVALSGMVENASGYIWNTSGDGTFSNPESLSPLYYPGAQDNAALSVVLELTAFGPGDCPEATDQLNITIQPLPVAMAGDDKAVCSGQHVQLNGNALNYSSVLWTTAGTGNFSNQHLLNPVYIPSNEDILNGGVTLYLRANGLNGCNHVTDTLQLTINTPPEVIAGNDQNICASEIVQLSASASNYDGVQWSTGGDGTFDDATILAPQYYPGVQDISSGTVLLQITAFGLTPCSNAGDELTINLFDPPQIIPFTDINSCIAEPVELVANAMNYQSLQWLTEGDGTFDDDQLLTAIYYPGPEDLQQQSVNICLTATGFGMCEPAVSCLEIILIAPPEVDAGDNSMIVQGNPFTTDQASASNYSTLLWETSGSGTFADAASLVTSYFPSGVDVSNGTVNLTLTAFPENPCQDPVQDTLLLTIIQTTCIDAEIFAGNNRIICETDNIHLDEATAMFTTSLLWSTSGDGTFDDATALHPVYTPGSGDIAAGNVLVSLTGFAAEGCDDDIHSLEITLQPMPVVFAGSDNTLPGLIPYTVTDAWAENFTDILWFNTNGGGDFENASIMNPTYFPSTIDLLQGSVILQMTVSPVNPCEAGVSSTVIIHFVEECNDAIADAGEDMAICSDEEEIQLNGYASGFSSLLWTTTGDGSFNYPNTAAPKYYPGQNDRQADSIKLYLHAEAFEGCSPAIDSLILSPLVTPFVDAGIDQTLCGDEPAIIEDAWATGFATLQWSTNGDGTFSSANTLETVYTPGTEDLVNQLAILTLTATSPEPCQVSVSSSLELTLLTGPEIIININDQEVPYGENAVFTIASYSATNYQWYGPNGMMPGKNYPVLVLAGVTFEDSGNYYCVLSNACGQTTSNTAELTVYQQQVINIPEGWSGVSSYIKPHNLSMDNIFSDYMNDFLLIKNFDGIYYPEIPINSLALWNSNTGYEAIFINAVEFVIRGTENTNRTVNLNAGWNYLPVISPCEVEIEALFGNNMQYVDLIKDIAGTCIFWPQHGINTIGMLTPGKAYFAKVNQQFSITYEECQQAKSGTRVEVFRPENKTTWDDPVYSPASHTIAIDDRLAAALNPGDIIGAFTRDGIMAGFVELSGGKNVLTVFGDDPVTTTREGFSPDEKMSFRLYRADNGLEYNLRAVFDETYPHSGGTFINHGISGLTRQDDQSPPIEDLPLSSVHLYPNPTTGQMNITGIPEQAFVEIWSADGQKMPGLMPEQILADQNETVVFDLSGYSRGVYFVRISSGEATILKKVVLN